MVLLHTPGLPSVTSPPIPLTAIHVDNTHDSTPVTSCLKCGHKEVTETILHNHISEVHCSNIPQSDGNVFLPSSLDNSTHENSTLDTASLHDHFDDSLPSIDENSFFFDTLGDTNNKSLPVSSVR